MEAKPTSPKINLPSGLQSRSAPIIESAPMPIVEVQGGGHLVSYVNSAFCRLIGKTRGELIGMAFSGIVHGGDQCVPILDRVYRSGEAATHVLEDDSDPTPAYWLYAMWPALDANERPVGVIIQLAKAANFQQKGAEVNAALLIAGLRQHELAQESNTLNTLLRLEIAQREQTEKALRESEERLSIILEQIPVGVALLDLAGRAVLRNKNMHRFMGDVLPSQDPEHIHRWRRLARDSAPLDPSDMPGVRALRGESVQGLELILTQPDGSEIWTSITTAPLRDTAGAATGAVVMIQDITWRKLASVALEESRTVLEQHAQTLELRVAERTTKLQETISELESFSYSISHDLRAPLRAMRSFAAILASDCGQQLSADGKEYVRRIMTAAGRMDELIQDVLVYSRVARAEMPLERIELASFIAGILESYPQFDPTHAVIEVVIPLAPVQANPVALTQCISNLIDNAIKFVAPGVKPHVRIWTDVIAGSRVRLYFRDNGVGIAQAAQPGIFGIFNQIDPRRGGTGIGLAIVRKAAERLGGSVSVQSEPGQGSTFQLELNSALAI
jgi:signal transduction histidine kinase